MKQQDQDPPQVLKQLKTNTIKVYIRSKTRASSSYKSLIKKIMFDGAKGGCYGFILNVVSLIMEP